MRFEEKLFDLGIVPVAVISKIEDAIPVAQALINGGLPAIEVTFRTDIAAGAIHLIKQTFPQMVVGAGTLLNIDQVKQAIQVGADFFVAPGFNHELIKQSWQYDIQFIPGCATTSEIDYAIRNNINLVKFFPAEANNARQYIPALSGPYPNMKYMPTGGINLQNLDEYLGIKNVVCCGGSWITSKTLIDQGNFDEVRNCAEIVSNKVKVIRGR